VSVDAMAVSYALNMERLLACPFCRELFPAGEQARCPACGLSLRPMNELPPSLDVLEEEAARGEYVAPAERELPRYYFRRGRGALLVIGVLGLAAFFLPWVRMTSPEIASYSAFDLARGRAGWLWGGAVGWFILLPLVWTRRSVARMRGVRVICAVFAAMTLVEVLMMVALPPRSNRLYPVEFEWGFGLYASAIVSALGVAVAARFGGRADDLPAVPWRDAKGAVQRETSTGETLH
jgi:hypothetical protein